MPMGEIGDNNEDEAATGWNNIQGAFWRAGGIGQDLELEEVTPKFADEAVEFLAGAPEDRPFFLYLAFPSPHTPWLPTEEFVGKSGAGMYGDFMMTVDHAVGRVLGQLEESGHAEDTLVIFTSDNGPVWYDTNEEQYDHVSTGMVKGMKGDNWEGGHRVPFIVRLPGSVEAGSTDDSLISFLDVAATLCDLAGVEAERPEDSISFAHALLGQEAGAGAVRESLFHGKKFHACLRSGKWKLLEHQGSAGFSKREEPKPGPDDPPGQLYDMVEDPGETTNLWNERPEVVERLLGELRAKRNELFSSREEG